MAGQNSNRTGKPYIAIAMGNAKQRSQLAADLMSFYRFAEYPDSAATVAGCRACLPLLVLVGEELPASNGFDFVRTLRLDPAFAALPVIIIVDQEDRRNHYRVTQCGAQGHLVMPYSRSALITTISTLLNHSVESEWKTLPMVQRQALDGTLKLFNGIADVISNGEPIAYQVLSNACEPLVEAVGSNDFKGILQGVRNHDNYSYVHSIRVATYLALFGTNLNLPKDEQILLATGGLLHDVGKMAIAHEVLNKAGRLTIAEFAVMQKHVTASVAYLQCCPDLPTGIITIAAQHHEKLDGTGYPFGLAGNKLNRLARIAAIIDVFTALTDRRVYKPSMEAEVALKLMTDEMASHLDIKFLGLFRQMLLDATPH